jgi:hypothetical protein
MVGEKLVSSQFETSVRARSLVAVLPLVALVVVPALDSPFLAAKTGILLPCGAIAAVFLALRAPIAADASIEAVRAASAVASDSSSAARAIRFLGLAAFAYCAAVCISLFATRHWSEAWPVLAPIAAATCIFLALFRMRARISVAALLASISLAAVSVAILALAGRTGFDLPRLLAGAAAPGRMRAAATLGNPLFVASFLASSFWSIFALDRVRRVWRYAAAVVVLAGMAATAERTVALASVIGAVAYLIASPRAAASRRRTLQLCALLLAAGILFAAASASNPRSLRTALRGRIFLWSTALRHVTLFGAGPGSFYRIYNQNLLAAAPSLPPDSFHFVRYETDADSIAVQSLVETGVVGFLALAAAFAMWFRFAWQRRSAAAVCCAIAGVAAFLAAGLVDDPFARPEGLALLAFWLAVPLFAARDNSKSSASASTSRHPERRGGSFLPSSASARTSRLAVEGSLPALARTIAFVALALALATAAGATLFASYAVAAGNAAESRADWTAAERWDRAALRTDPASRDARFNLVRALCESAHYDACFAESDSALAWVNEAELHLIRVRALEMLGRADAAEIELLAARRQFPWSTDLQQEEIEYQTEAPPTPSVVVELNKE